jgi:hypothetical protein
LIDVALAFDLDDTELMKRLDAPGGKVTSPLLSLPTPAASASPFGTWTKLETERNGDEGRTKSGVGLNYKPAQTATFGMAVESEENKVDTSLSEQTKLAATFGLKPSTLFNFEARAAWAHQNSGTELHTDAQSAQGELSARINGDWQLGAFKLAPNLTVTRPAEVAMVEGANVPRGSIVVAPTLSRAVKLDGTQALEPFVTFKHEIDISSAAAATHVGSTLKTETARSLGGGVKLNESKGYSLSVSTNIENLEAERQSLRSEFRINVPLK